MVATTQLSTISIVLLRARTQWDSSGDLDRTAAELSEMDTTVRQEVTRFEGFVAARVGTLWQAVFGAHKDTEDQDERAVLAALHIRRRLTTNNTRTVRAAVVSSEVSIEALNDCHTWLPRVPAMEIWVSDQTRQRTESRITYRPTSTGMWAATAPS
jgi:class 3 adenylate cyclase